MCRVFGRIDWRCGLRTCSEYVTLSSDQFRPMELLFKQEGPIWNLFIWRLEYHKIVRTCSTVILWTLLYLSPLHVVARTRAMDIVVRIMEHYLTENWVSFSPSLSLNLNFFATQLIKNVNELFKGNIPLHTILWYEAGLWQVQDSGAVLFQKEIPEG